MTIVGRNFGEIPTNVSLVDKKCFAAIVGYKKKNNYLKKSLTIGCNSKRRTKKDSVVIYQAIDREVLVWSFEHNHTSINTFKTENPLGLPIAVDLRGFFVKKYLEITGHIFNTTFIAPVVNNSIL